jgi:hypothetical protein
VEPLRIRKRYLPLDLHHGPRLAVDQDHIAVKARLAVVVEQQLAGVREDRVPHDEGHLVSALRDRQVSLLLVADDVEGRQPHVGVGGGDVDTVVVVPERARVVGVRVAVVLELPRLRDVVGVAVVLR